MESLSIVLSSSPPLQTRPKTHKSLTSKTISLLPNSHQTHFPSNETPHIPQIFTPNFHSIKPLTTHFPNPFFSQISVKQSPLSFILTGFFTSLPCFASEAVQPSEQVSVKINLEAILVSIDDFFNRYPFFVAGVTFIWLVVIPLTQEYLKKYKFISAIDAFRKLREDPNSQLLDIRGEKSLVYLGSPNLKILNKSGVQVQYSEGDEQGFVKKVLENFEDPANTTVCILDNALMRSDPLITQTWVTGFVVPINFDGDSMKVAELLFNNGFKEAYAIRGGVRGKNGWQEIQENLLPPSVHISAKKKVKMSKQFEMNGGVNQQTEKNYEDGSRRMDNGYVNRSMESSPKTKLDSRSSSPYPNYPDLKPPSSPTPAKPRT